MVESDLKMGNHFLHEEGEKYQFLAFAQKVESKKEGFGFVGEALCAEGFEETHKSDRSKKIKVYGNGERFEFVQVFPNEIPDNVVFYVQESKDKHFGQLWWRPVEDFLQHFSPV